MKDRVRQSLFKGTRLLADQAAATGDVDAANQVVSNLQILLPISKDPGGDFADLSPIDPDFKPTDDYWERKAKAERASDRWDHEVGH